MRSDEVVKLVQQKIQSGELTPGDRLPTHRSMAWDLDCSVGTVTRAYGDLERRGITYGQVGRGTYVAPLGKNLRPGNPLTSFVEMDAASGNMADLSLNRFYHPGCGQAFSDGFSRLSQRTPSPTYESYIDTKGRTEDLEIGAEWISGMIGPVDPENVIVTQGAQSGLYLAMKALTKPSDAIATEIFGYPGIKAAAQECGLKVIGVQMDEHGMLPSSFLEECRKTKIRMLVTTPTNHNPTGTTLTLERRRQILEIAKEYNIPVVEDGVYAPFQQEKIASFYELAPENSLFLTSFSKVFSPGLRIGYIVAPRRFLSQILSASKAINWATSPVILDLANHLVSIGVIERHQRELIREGEIRFRLAQNLLRDWLHPQHNDRQFFLPHLWLRLPPAVTPSEFIEVARQNGIAVIGGDRFAMSRNIDDHFIRICLMALPEQEQLKKALERLVDLLMNADAQPLIS